MVSKHDVYELKSMLFEIAEKGHVFVSKYKVWRVLGKGSGAAGTWSALLDEWEETTGQERSKLHIFELNGQYFLSYNPTASVMAWAGEA